MSDDDLIEFATEFRNGILGGRPSWMMCFAVAAPLEGLLSALGIKADLVKFDAGECEHYFLQLPDGRVLDPTADQLIELGGDPMPPVYLGPPTKMHGAAL